MLCKNFLPYLRLMVCCYYVLGCIFCSAGMQSTNLGCWKDKRNRAIPTLEGQDPILGGKYQNRLDAWFKCATASHRRGFTVFALQVSFRNLTIICGDGLNHTQEQAMHSIWAKRSVWHRNI